MGNFEEWRKLNEFGTPQPPKRIRLEEKHFADLVAGKEVEIDGVKIILADFGWDRMVELIKKAGW